jgi:hypothetical protein
MILYVVIGSMVATTINPYGLRLWGFLYHTATVPRPDITEWQPLVLMTRYGLTYAAFVAAAVWGLLHSRKDRSPALLTALIVVTLLPLIAVRHTPLSALTIGVLAGEHISDAWERFLVTRSRSQSSAPRRIEIAATALLFGSAGLFMALSVPHFSCIRVDPSIGGSYPARAIALIKQSGVAGNLAIHFSWGEYAIYHLGPSVKVSVDGRRETAYPNTAYIENQHFMRGLGDWDALLRNHDSHLALVRSGLPVFNLLKQKPGWRLIYEDPLAGLFGRNGAPAVATISATVPPSLPPDGAGLCFP